jgi:hypothetical protein
MAIFVSGSDETSGKTQRDNFVFAGWVAPEEEWSRFFAPAWQERVLDGPPAIPYLHMTDIRSPRWREEYRISQLDADDRIDEAFRLIDTMQSLYPVGIMVDAGHVRDRFAKTRVTALRLKAKARAFEPDFVCFLAYSWIVLNYLDQHHPEAEKVDFVVEKNGATTKHIQDFHSALAQSLEALGNPSLARFVGDIIPGEKGRIPLQAADLLCWHTARSRHPETMDLADRRRYATIAHRKGTYEQISNEQVFRMAETLGVSS